MFLYETAGDPREAFRLARNAFEDAIGEGSETPEEGYRQSTIIMQRLRDNLTLWSEEDPTLLR